VFTGVRLTDRSELLCDAQESGGHGIGEALGLGGVTNLDVRAKYDLEQSAVHRTADVASDHSAERRESDFGANSVLSLQLAARETAGSSLRQIQHGGFFRI